MSMTLALKRHLVSIASACLLNLLNVPLISQDKDIIPERVRADWQAQTKDGGTWITHDNIQGNSFDAFGMKFTMGLGEKSMKAVLYMIREGKNIGSLWEYRIYYHPIDKQLILQQYGSDGTVGVGEILVYENLKSENISTFYNPDGSIVKLKHMQHIQGDVKISETFTFDEEHGWVKARSYKWTRIKDRAAGS